MSRIKAARYSRSTPPFDFIYGRYHLSKWRIPYFATTMTLRDAAESLRLISEFPGLERRSMNLDELYQRDLDWPRVERQIVPYLSNLEQPQFFNSLTVALLPIMGNEFRSNFEGNDWTPPDGDGENDFRKIIQVGPIRFSYWENWETTDDPGINLGRIRWNPDQVFSVTIDGQHRLASIKRYVDREGNEPKLIRTRIPVILIIFDDRIGYEHSGEQEIVDVLRSLFIDLNKHAKPVSRGRQILLDDKDPHSLCVRALVGNVLQDGYKEIYEKPPRLPLSLVDWHSDQAKFDEGPYVTTILGLDWIVSKLLGSKPISDYMDYKGIRRQLRAFRRSLGLVFQDTEERLNQLEEMEIQPFSYLDTTENNELDLIMKAFATVWGPPTVKILTEFIPYNDLITARNAKNTFTAEFANWYFHYFRKQKDKFETRATQEYNQFISRVAARPDNPVSENMFLTMLEGATGPKNDNLAFLVVFQRALFEAFLEFQKIDDDHIEELFYEDLEEFGSILEDEYEEEEEDEYEEEEYDEYEKEEYEEDEEEYDLEAQLGLQTEEKAELVKDRAELFIEGLNRMVENDPTFLDKYCSFDRDGVEDALWAGSILSPEGTIDFTLGASKRAKEILFWVACLHLCTKKADPLCRNGFDDFWDAFEETGKEVHNRLARSIKRFSKDDTSSPAYRILKGRENAYDELKAEIEAKSRLRSIWERLEI